MTTSFFWSGSWRPWTNRREITNRPTSVRMSKVVDATHRENCEVMSELVLGVARATYQARTPPLCKNPRTCQIASQGGDQN